MGYSFDKTFNIILMFESMPCDNQIRFNFLILIVIIEFVQTIIPVSVFPTRIKGMVFHS